MVQPKKPLVRNSIDSVRSEQLMESRAMTPIMKKTQRICIEALEAQLINMLNTADDRLFDMAETSYNNAQFDAMRLLRVKREGLIRNFKQEISNNFRSLLFRLDDEPIIENIEHLSLENISLVKDDDLEEKIAIDGMAKKAEVANHIALDHIRQRLDTLIEDKSVASNDIPIAPKAVCLAFKNATKTLDLDIASLLIIYKLFDRSIMQLLASVYSKLNHLFIEEGILPHLTEGLITTTNSIEHSNSHSSVTAEDIVGQLAINQQQTSQGAPPRTVAQQQETAQNTLLSEIHQLLANSRNSNAVVTGESVGQSTNLGGQVANVTPLETTQLVDVLTQLQNNHSQSQPSVIPAGTIKESLTVAIPQLDSANVGQAIGSLNEDMIDIVSMLFDFILEDDSIQSEVKSVIGRLQIPMLKVGLVDPKFITNRRHPARLLLNELAHAGISCDMKDPASKPMFEKIQLIADKIIQDFNQDISLFDELLAEFNQFKTKFLQKTNIFEKRIKEAEEGKAKAETARAEVNQLLTQLCRKKRLPKVVKSILKNIWSHVMLLEKLKDNAEGWESRKKVAKLLIWSVQKTNSTERLDKLINKVPILVKSIKTGAELISFSPIETTHLLESLEDEHRSIIEAAKATINRAQNEDIIRLPAIDLDAPSAEEFALESSELSNPIAKAELEEEIIIEDIGFTSVETGEIFRQTTAEPIPIDNKAMQTVEQLRAGSWIELKVDGEFKRCKLAARIASTGKYIFVNRSGMKMAEMLTIDLCQAYQLGDMKILDDDALFDRALESVITNLRAMKA